MFPSDRPTPRLDSICLFRFQPGTTVTNSKYSKIVSLWPRKLPTLCSTEMNIRFERRLPAAHVRSLHKFKFKWMAKCFAIENCVLTLRTNGKIVYMFLCDHQIFVSRALIDTFLSTGLRYCYIVRQRRPMQYQCKSNAHIAARAFALHILCIINAYG